MKRSELKGIILRAYFDISRKKDYHLLQEIAKRNEEDRKETQDGPVKNLGSTINVHGYKKNARNIIIRFVSRVAKFVIHDKKKRYRAEKLLICALYNRLHLLKYISNKRINCFIWKDDGADKAYIQYQEMMNSVYEKCSLEIIVLE